MRRGIKIALITLVVLIIAVAGMAVQLFGLRTFIGPRKRDLTGQTFTSTPARMERGKYIANSMGCLYCHSPHDFSKRDEPISAGMLGAGQQLPYADLPGRIIAPNLTPDKDTGTGTWSDDAMARAIREGIGHDGRALFPIMPYQHYRTMPDEDLASVVVYLRSLPAVRNQLAKTEVIFPVKYLIRNAPQPITAPVPQPDLSDSVKRGAFLVNLVGCADCHTPIDNHHNPIPGMDFSGGQIIALGSAKVASANLTPDPSGIPYYDEKLFIQAMRTGNVGARELSDAMPWVVLGKMTDQDLGAIFAYLKTLKPVTHHVDNSLPPTLCPIDGAMHGGGDQNRKP
ncbi:MAG TPA: c-type cytochrome [Terriglobales bacterium]|nr:c-type cytochrome [Terriglobales bacterium]